MCTHPALSSFFSNEVLAPPLPFSSSSPLAKKLQPARPKRKGGKEGGGSCGCGAKGGKSKLLPPSQKSSHHFLLTLHPLFIGRSQLGGEGGTCTSPPMEKEGGKGGSRFRERVLPSSPRLRKKKKQYFATYKYGFLHSPTSQLLCRRSAHTFSAVWNRWESYEKIGATSKVFLRSSARQCWIQNCDAEQRGAEKEGRGLTFPPLHCNTLYMAEIALLPRSFSRICSSLELFFRTALFFPRAKKKKRRNGGKRGMQQPNRWGLRRGLMGPWGSNTGGAESERTRRWMPPFPPPSPCLLGGAEI